MVIRSACLIFVGGMLGVAAQAAAQAGYPQPQPQPQPQYAPPPGQPAPAPQPQYQQPVPQQQYQQPAPAPQPQYQPAPAAQPAPAPGAYPQPQPAPFGAQPAPAPGYPPAPDQQQQYSGFPVPPPDTSVPPPGGIPNGAFQLGLSTTLVRYEPLTLEDEAGNEQDNSELFWGIGENPLALELGYGLSDQLVFGGIVGLGGSSNSVGENQDESKFTFELGPKLDYMFSPGAKVNPFIGALVLVHLESTTIEQGTTKQEQSATAFLFLARIGLRAFVTDTFSIDPALVAGGGLGSGSVESGGEFDFDLTGFRIGLNIGFSGWML